MSAPGANDDATRAATFLQVAATIAAALIRHRPSTTEAEAIELTERLYAALARSPPSNAD